MNAQDKAEALRLLANIVSINDGSGGIQIKSVGQLSGNAVALRALIERQPCDKEEHPEWVPLDLAKVKQGQEVRHKDWLDSDAEKFVCIWNGSGYITEHRNGDLGKRFSYANWLMRAPKPKTVRVRVYTRAGSKEPIVVRETFPVSDDCILIGEGDIEVRE